MLPDSIAGVWLLDTNPSSGYLQKASNLVQGPMRGMSCMNWETSSVRFSVMCCEEQRLELF